MRTLITLFVSLLFVTNIQAATINVPGDHATIQQTTRVGELNLKVSEKSYLKVTKPQRHTKTFQFSL